MDTLTAKEGLKNLIYAVQKSNNMQVEIKDKDKTILAGVQAAGFDIDSKNLERILNITDYIRGKHGEVTLKEILELKDLVDGLYD